MIEIKKDKAMVYIRSYVNVHSYDDSLEAIEDFVANELVNDCNVAFNSWLLRMHTWLRETYHQEYLAICDELNKPVESYIPKDLTEVEPRKRFPNQFKELVARFVQENKLYGSHNINHTIYKLRSSTPDYLKDFKDEIYHLSYKVFKNWQNRDKCKWMFDPEYREAVI